jgi:hypothetical protein
LSGHACIRRIAHHALDRVKRWQHQAAAFRHAELDCLVPVKHAGGPEP